VVVSRLRAVGSAGRMTSRVRGALSALACLWAYLGAGFRDAPASGRRALVWGAVLLVSFVGFGSAAARVVDRDVTPNVGLRAAWGMAVVLPIGALLLACRSATAPALRVLVAVGLAAFCAEAFRAGKEKSSIWTESFALWLLPVVAVLAFVLSVGALGWKGQWNSFDDMPAYFVLPKQIAQTGDMIQPFSFRRISSFGAQSLFQAMLLIGADSEQSHLFDQGLCTIVLVTMILGGGGRKSGASPFALRALVAILVLLLPNYRMNSASFASGAVFLFAIYETLEMPDTKTRSLSFLAVLLGLLVAGAWALRPFFVVPALGAVALSYLFQIRRRRGDAKRLFTEAVIATAALVLALLPWSIALLHSNGTPLFPGYHGGYRPESGHAKIVMGYERLKAMASDMGYWEPIGTMHLFFIAWLLFRDSSPRQAARASTLALLAGFLVLEVLIPITDYRDLARYRFPLEAPFVAIVALGAFGAFGSFGPRRRALPAAAVALVATVGELFFQHEEGDEIFDGYARAAYGLVRPSAVTPPVPVPPEADYAEMQRSVPAGEPILAMLTEAYRFDFRRNPIEILDIPGSVSPGPGLPVFQGPEALSGYLLSLGIRHVAFVDPRKCETLYQLSAWQRHATNGERMMANFIAPSILDIFENLDRLSQTRHHVFDGERTAVLDLTELR
jgi:hypothetical protein